jgi:Putative DNA-binding domain
MLSLAEMQTRLRDAIVDHDVAGALPLLTGGRDAAGRLAVHRRHFEASLVLALLEKFPATTWLIGAQAMTEAARTFVHRHPPKTPCIAEYGVEFPNFVAGRVGAERVPYLGSFAEFEWHLGHAAIAIDRPPLGIQAFASISVDLLPDIRLALQPGLHYGTAAWPIDDLVRLYLSEAAPAQYTFEPADVYLEICGARGEFRIDRLDPATFAFRRTLAERETIEVAAERALERDGAFDPGQALTALVAGGLVVAIIEQVGAQR